MLCPKYTNTFGSTSEVSNLVEQTHKRGIQISTSTSSVAVTSQFKEDSMEDLKKLAEELLDKYGK